MFPNRLTPNLAQAACVLFEVRHLPLKVFRNPPRHEDINIFQKKIAMGFSADWYPVNRIISKKHLKAGNRVILVSLFLLQYTS